jgi:hypothetical protein
LGRFLLFYKPVDISPKSFSVHKKIIGKKFLFVIILLDYILV